MTLAVGILCVYWSKCATRWWLKTYWSDRLGEEAAPFFNPKLKIKNAAQAQLMDRPNANYFSKRETPT